MRDTHWRGLETPLCLLPSESLTSGCCSTLQRQSEEKGAWSATGVVVGETKDLVAPAQVSRSTLGGFTEMA